MPYATQEYEQNNQARYTFDSGQQFFGGPYRQQRSSGSTKSISRKQDHHRNTRTTSQFNEPLTHRRHQRLSYHHPKYPLDQNYQSANPSKDSNCNDKNYSTYPYQLRPLSTELQDTSARLQTSTSRDRNQCHHRTNRNRRPKSSDPSCREYTRGLENMDGVDPRVVMMQWNSGFMAPNKRGGGTKPETMDLAGRPPLAAPYFSDPVRTETMKPFDIFQRSKPPPNPDFAVPISSWDNILGIGKLVKI